MKNGVRVEEAEIVVHESDQPDAVGDLFHSDALASETWLTLTLSFPMQIRPQGVTVTVRSWSG